MRAADGTWLALRRYVPVGRPRRAVVLAMHAMMVNGTSLDRPRGRGFASHLATEGIETFVLDFRGHGLSQRPARGWTLDDYATLDLPAAIAATGVAPEQLVWIGHSLGGLVSLAALARGSAPTPRALVLGTTNVWRQPSALVRRLIVEAFDGSARLLGKAPIRALGFGTDDEPASYTRHLARWVHTGRFTSADGAVDYDSALPSLRLPVLTLIGTGDPLCGVRDARDFTRRLSSATHREVIVPGATHFTIWSSPAVRRAVVEHAAEV